MARSIAQLAAELEQAIIWLRRHRVEPGDRILRYVELLGAAVAAGPGQPLPIAEDAYYSTVFEVSQLCDIAQLPDPVFASAEKRTKLRMLGRGELHYFEAGNDDQGRDIGFELSTAAYFCMAGLNAQLDAPADVAVVREDGRSFQIECKRPRRVASLAANLMRAYEQIADHRHEAPDAIAMVAIDLTLVWNPEFRPIRYPTMLAAANAFDEHLYNFELKNRQAYVDARHNSRGAELMSGRLYKFQGMFHLDDGTTNVGTFWRIAMTQAEQDSPTGQEIRRVFERLVEND